MNHMLKCQVCSGYSFEEKCKCGGISVKVGPAKFNPEDPYGTYRRKAKESQRAEAGLI